MKTTVQFLDAVRDRYGLTSDYQLAKLLGVGQTNISRYRNRGGTMDDHIAIRVAELLKLDPGYVLACVQAERAATEEVRKIWTKTAKALAGTAVAILAGCALSLAPLPHLVPTASAAPGLYIMLNNIQFSKYSVNRCSHRTKPRTSASAPLLASRALISCR